ncbi:SIS domain-containing protein [Prosthecomicrobium sp. N25]|uniref:SIS domain-containing protein n=1 Tax=Prosthecomicrobium sp. N25 TaxID=3129254 RepID=UPI003076E33F
MSIAYDAPATLAGFDQTRRQLADAYALGRSLAGDVDRIHFVACGSANRAMRGLAWWIEHLSPSLEVKRSFPAEFMAQDPRRLDGRTLVFLASKSGNTPETVAAAGFLKDRPAKVVAFSQFADRPLAREVGTTFLVGDTAESFTAMAMLMHALVAGLLAERDGWTEAGNLMAGLDALPAAVCQAAVANDARAARDAEAFRDDDRIYHVASGPGFTTAYVFGVCILMEMLWLHSYPIDAAEFFHGPFEIVDKQTPLVLLMGEDPTRPIMDRVERFCDTYAERVMKYDSRVYPMPGVPASARPILAPYVLQAALKRYAAHLSVLRDQPLSTRRYMWKVAY